MPALLKKAADTNVFISEASDSALISVCSGLSENRVFNSLQNIQNIKSNPMKMKMALCYNALIDKLGPKFRQFQNYEKLVTMVVQFMNEGALEVRNMGK